MNFKNLADAIVLTVGFEHSRSAARVIRFSDDHIGRNHYWVAEVVELRKNSDFTTEAEFRLITAKFVIEAVQIKVDAYFRSLNAGGGFKVHYTNGATPFHCKTFYRREGDARRAAEKLNARQSGGYEYSSVKAYISKTRGKIVINMMSRSPVMETTGTNYSNSVASEAYWSA
jgi:hypothetical protein